MRFVPIKTDDQLDLQAIHRVRDRLISRRTAVINQLRAFLLERGMVFAQKPAKLKAVMIDILESAKADLTSQMRNLIDMLWGKHNRGFGGEKRGSGDMSRNYRRQGLYTGNSYYGLVM
jgi:transposase